MRDRIAALLTGVSALSVALVAGGHSAAALAVAEQSKLEWSRLTGVALARHDLGRPRESQAAIDALVRTHANDAAYQIAEIHAWRGETDLAFEWLERARLQLGVYACTPRGTRWGPMGRTAGPVR